MQPVCAICGKPPVSGALEMHETFITRGDIRGNKDLLSDIMSRYNCVLVHPTCHQHANSDEGKIACAKDIVEHEGYENVISWLEHIQSQMRSSTPTQAIRLVKEVQNEVQGL